MKPSITRWKATLSYSPARASALIRSTCRGATSGSISTTTCPPSLSSIRSVFSGSLISAMAFPPGQFPRRTLGAPPAGEKPQTRAPTLFWANFSASARATMGGTKPEMSPPSRAISLTSREAIAW